MSRRLWLGLWVATLSSLTAGPARGDVIDRVLAVVNGHLITLSDVRASLRLGLIEPAGAAAEQTAVQRWIDRVLVLQEVERYAPPDPSVSETERALSRVRDRLGGVEAFSSAVARLGVTEDWVRHWVRDELRIRAYVDQRFAASIEPSDDEIENYLREHAAELAAREGGRTRTDARSLARERVADERRAAVVGEWLEDLRRRATITRPAPR
jgi:hypothetical protein